MSQISSLVKIMIQLIKIHFTSQSWEMYCIMYLSIPFPFGSSWFWLMTLEGIYLGILYLEIKGKSIPSSSLPAGKHGSARPMFWWPGFPYMCVMTGLHPRMSAQNTVIVPQLCLSQISHLNEKDRKRQIKLFIVLLSRLNNQLIDARFLWFQPVSIASLATTKVFIALVYFQRPRPMNIPSVLWSPRGPRMGLVRAQGKKLLCKTMSCLLYKTVCLTFSLLVLSPGHTGGGLKICRPLKRSTLSCTLKENRRESQQALPCYAIEKLLDYTGIQP